MIKKPNKCYVEFRDSVIWYTRTNSHQITLRSIYLLARI